MKGLTEMSDKELLDRLRAKKSVQMILKKIMFITGLGSIVSLVFIPVVYNSDGKWYIPLVVMVGFMLLTFLIWTYVNHVETELEQELGTDFIERILSERVELLDYQPFKTMSYNQLKHSKLFGTYDNVKGADYFKAVYNGVAFEYCDAVLTSEGIDSGNVKSSYTEFEGGVMTIQIPHQIKGTVIVREKGSSKTFEKIENSVAPSGMIDIITGDEEFDSKFRVEVSEPGEEKNILTPAFINRLSGLGNDIAGRLFVSVQEDGITVAISKGGDRFDIPPVHKMKDPDKFKDMYRAQLKELLDIVNAFTPV